MRQVTLGFLVKDNKVLLAMKKRGFGEGWWNGVGGKLKDGEDLEEALIRECQEEINCTPKSFQKVAILDFYFPKEKSDWNQQCHVYLIDSWEGQPSESEEMKPQWFDKDNLPLDQMWDADKIWLPKILSGKMIKAKIYFDDNIKLKSYEEV